MTFVGKEGGKTCISQPGPALWASLNWKRICSFGSDNRHRQIPGRKWPGVEQQDWFVSAHLPKALLVEGKDWNCRREKRTWANMMI